MALVPMTVEEGLAGILANREKGVPTFVISKNPNAKVHKGTTFFNLTATFNGKVANGYYEGTNIQISKGYCDPRDKTDKRNDFEKARFKFDSDVRAAGTTGLFLKEANVEWLSAVNTAIANGVIVLGKQDIHSLITTDSKTEKGKYAENPFVSFAYPQGVFSDKHPIADLRGKLQCELVDFTKFDIVEKNGKHTKQCKPLCATDGTIANDANMHTVIRSGTMFNRLRFQMNSVPLSAGWLSLKIEANKAWVTPRDPAAGAFDEPDMECSAADLAALGLGGKTAVSATAPATASAAPATASGGGQTTSDAHSDGEPAGESDDDAS